MLFLKEGRKIVCSVIFLIFIGGFYIFLNSQAVMKFTDADKIHLPLEGEDYGTRAEEIPKLVMPEALKALYREYTVNEYTAYPIGFYKNVRLNEKQQEEMTQILAHLSGLPAEEIRKSAVTRKEEQTGTAQYQIGQDIQVQGDGSVTITMPGQETVTDGSEKTKESRDGTGGNGIAETGLPLKPELAYEEFKEYMQKADDLIGGGTNYAAGSLKGFGQAQVTYEEALESYGLVKDSDHFTGAYARLFSDYCVTMMGILPVFLAIGLCLKDRKKNVAEVLYTRKASTARIILTRYAALLTAVMVPVIVLSYLSNSSVWGMYAGEELNYLAPLTYALGWVMPTVMMVLAAGMFLTELTGTPVAAALQVFWWLVDINLGAAVMSSGNYTLLRLMPRHNSKMHTDVFLENFSRLVSNRLLFAGLALALIGATVCVYHLKREGRLHGSYAIQKCISRMGHRQSQPEA